MFSQDQSDLTRSRHIPNIKTFHETIGHEYLPQSYGKVMELYW